MEQLDMNVLLERSNLETSIHQFLQQFETQKNLYASKRGIYVYGEPGIGKTTFVLQTLQHAGYDVVKYDCSDIRNKSITDLISNNNTSDKNVLSMYQGNVKKIAIVLDEIDSINNGDKKGGLSSLIKLIRPKKTKKQKKKMISPCCQSFVLAIVIPIKKSKN